MAATSELDRTPFGRSSFHRKRAGISRGLSRPGIRTGGGCFSLNETEHLGIGTCFKRVQTSLLALNIQGAAG